jgi:hypothetical protein
MFDSPNTAGTTQTTAIPWLVIAFIFIPAVLILSRSFGYLPLSVAIACSMTCLAVAWVNWRKYLRLTMRSVSVRSYK